MRVGGGGTIDTELREMTAKAPRRSLRRHSTSPWRILIATAGESESRGALNVAAALAARRGARVTALGVAVPFPHNLSTLLSAKPPASVDEEERERLLGEIRRSLNGIPGTRAWTVRAAIGMPADVILTAAPSIEADLVLIGVGRHNRMDRIFGSETAVAVMRHARLPVLAVPMRATGLPRRAVAALDFTAASLAAAAQAKRLLADGGTLYVAHVAAFSGSEAKPGDLVDIYRAGARAKLDEAAKSLGRHGKVRVVPTMLDGDPGKSIVAFARRQSCDVIALGGHHLSLADRVLLGSVRTRILRSAPCAVLIVPPDTSA